MFAAGVNHQKIKRIMTQEFTSTFLKCLDIAESGMKRREQKQDSILHDRLTKALKAELLRAIRGKEYDFARELGRFLKRKPVFKYLQYAALLSPDYLESERATGVVLLPDQDTVTFLKNLPDAPRTREKWIRDTLTEINV